jgi:hypothetical protein
VIFLLVLLPVWAVKCNTLVSQKNPVESILKSCNGETTRIIERRWARHVTNTAKMVYYDYMKHVPIQLLEGLFRTRD